MPCGPLGEHVRRWAGRSGKRPQERPGAPFGPSGDPNPRPRALRAVGGGCRSKGQSYIIRSGWPSDPGRCRKLRRPSLGLVHSPLSARLTTIRRSAPRDFRSRLPGLVRGAAAQRQQPRHKAPVGVRFAGPDKSVYLIGKGETPLRRSITAERFDGAYGSITRASRWKRPFAKQRP